MKYYSYEDFKTDTNSLIKQVNDFKPESIVGIARGGLTLAHAVSEGLALRDVQTIRTELYDEKDKRECISIFGECSFKDVKKVLIVDDIADTGETLNFIVGVLIEQNPNIEFKTATLFYKKTSSYEPHFWINEAKEWIDFFWESDFKVN